MRKELVEKMERAGAMAIIRLQDTKNVFLLVEALLKGGVTLVEVSLNTAGACDLISQMAVEFRGDLLLGAGTVTDREEAFRVLDAGAQYIVTPVTDIAIIRVAHEREAPVCMGAFSATEMLLAHRNHADIIKIFPADTVGPKYIKALKDPFPSLRLMPTGGITPENAQEWICNGASLLGVGGALCDKEAIRTGAFTVITEKARRLMDNIEQARAGKNV
ncbi:MAG: bifunctional 4-hydroxy-2-oxoglutarate aldolase/2-dehydro-3-deoxy-phosphogluconate aldolase [Puia sp.]|nr:bifunctional 4-hydroxy-2-oxoglutarate aldolase/2-dehydro-3-deoxy-phosphogluconate aldolase [Puia sp.]